MTKQRPMLNNTDIKLLKTIFATKDDFKSFATKKDLQRFATKDDIKRFATKDDLQRFATKKDLRKLRSDIIDDIVKYLSGNYVTKDEFNTLREKINLLPTKDEFFRAMDKMAAEYKKFQEERDVLLPQIEQIKKRLDVI